MRRSHLPSVWPWLLASAAMLVLQFHVPGQSESGDAASYYERGIERSRQREYDQAIADFDQVIRLNPKFAEAYFSRGNARHRKGDHDQAIADYNQAIHLDPDR